MVDDRPYAWSNAWFRWSIVSLAVLTVACFLVGFIVLPSVQRDFTAGGIWAAICRAAGLPSTWVAAAPSEDRAPSTAVVLTPAMGVRGPSDAVGRGATIAVQQCSMCHGAQGASEANAPNLAGQYPEVVIKQLLDYKLGARGGSFMQTLARNLSDQNIDDIARYYDSLPKARTTPARYDETSAPASRRASDVMAVPTTSSAHHGSRECRGSISSSSSRISEAERVATTVTHRCAT